MSLTRSGIDGLDILAESLNLSRSEFVERIGRGLIPIAMTPQLLALDGNRQQDDALTA
ncbi:MAG: hypothetical protein ACFBSF_10075 [Leptolyngbyaceae cyanobacterium]